MLVDLDDTIVDRAGAFAEWAATFVEQWRLGADALPWMIEHDRSGFRLRDEFFAGVRERFGVPLSVGELITEFYTVFPPLFTCADEVRDSLVRVRAEGWPIAIVTNGSPTQELKILAAGLDTLVDTWCISSVEGVRKPDPRLLEIAAERCSTTLAGAWLIGDAPDADIGAAVAAGVPSIWLRHGRLWPRDDYSPTFEADSFPEAVAMLPAPPQR
ncbi:MAG: HAD family hydrolase [Actinomycetota bacterium]|nr:HAD family hydrolase [Actinomycetota bacterium]